MTSLATLERDLGKLVDRHDRARDLGEFERWADDPVGFIGEGLGANPWARQIEIAEAVRDASLVVVRSANGCGKDWLAARLALWWVYCRRGLVLLTGPTERQVIEIVMGEVARAFATAKDLPGELYRTSLRLSREEQAGILAFTSTESSRLTGFHAPRVMAILTEAQGCEDFAWEGLLACATGDEDRVLAVGNPLAPSGRFYTVSRPRSGWKPIRISAFEHPNLREGRTVIPGGPSPSFVNRITSEFGRDSGVYQSRVEGEFPDRSEEGLFRRSWLERAAEQHEQRVFHHEAAHATPIIAVDPARYGPDSTVLTYRRGPVLEAMIEWHLTSITETVGRILEELRRLGLTNEAYVIVDSVGLGGGVVDTLIERNLRAYGFNGGSRAWDHQRFLNARAESYWQFRESLEAGELAMPADEALFDELLAITWRATSEGKIQIESKDQLRARLGRSPDRADSAAMALYRFVAGGREPGDYGVSI